MAYAWTFQARFDGGSTPFGFDSEADTDGILDLAHYTTLAKYPFNHCAPYEGAYALRIEPSGGTNVATLTEADMNIADDGTSFFRFPLYFGDNFTATADDVCALFELKGSGAAVTVAFGFKITAATDVIQLGVGAANTGAVPNSFGRAIKRDTWYTVELKTVIKTDGSGTVDLFITEDGGTQETVADAAVSSITNIAVTDGVLGLQDHLATTTGLILIGEFVMDDAQLYVKDRYAKNPIMDASGHVFVGPGWISGASQVADEGTQTMAVYDTDTANTNGGVTKQLLFFDAENQTSFSGELRFEKGCYVELGGTAPRGSINITESSNLPGVMGPRASNDAMVRHHARRKA